MICLVTPDLMAALLLLCTCTGVTVWWVIVLCFLGSMVVCSILVLFSYKTYQFVKSVFFPASQLPSHFREV